MKETVEEVAERLYPRQPSGSYYGNVELLEQEAFEQGAEYQQERMYSEEEVYDIVDETIEKFYKHFYTLTKAEMKEQWFEQFKKK